jgi:hypothetical protein
MSAWRRAAIEFLPSQKKLIEHSDSVGMLWVELWFVFCDAHRHPVNDTIIRGTYQFADWTLAKSRDDDMATSTCCHFYEHLPEEPEVRKQMPRFMSRADVLANSEIFKQRMGADEFLELLKEFEP